MAKRKRLYLVEEAAFKEAYDLHENSPLWRWFDAEGPIIRAYGKLSRDGTFVTFNYQDLTILVDAFVVQEIAE